MKGSSPLIWLTNCFSYYSCDSWDNSSLVLHLQDCRGRWTTPMSGKCCLALHSSRHSRDSTTPNPSIMPFTKFTSFTISKPTPVSGNSHTGMSSNEGSEIFATLAFTRWSHQQRIEVIFFPKNNVALKIQVSTLQWLDLIYQKTDCDLVFRWSETTSRPGRNHGSQEWGGCAPTRGKAISPFLSLTIIGGYYPIISAMSAQVGLLRACIRPA